MIARFHRLTARLRGDDRGAYLIELAFVMPFFLLFLMGVFDIGAQLYAKSVLSGAVESAARQNTLESNATSQTSIDDLVRAQMRRVAPYGTVSFTRLSYMDFNAVGQPEEFTDTNGNGIRDATECYQDANANGQWDSNRGRTGQGGANDAVLYRARFSFNRIFPLWRFLGQPQATTITVSTVLRNQPYANQTNSTTVRCT
jgi:Flp pilus assembly protein TadG